MERGDGLLFQTEHVIIAASCRGGEHGMSDRKTSKKQKTKQMIALIVAGVMIFSVVAAAILSQIW